MWLRLASTEDRPNGSDMTMWQPLQLHFHAPSEHTHMGRHYDAEMHVVHIPVNGESATPGFAGSYETADEFEGNLAVFGVWFEESDCESMEEEKEDCMIARATSDEFFAAM
jgi:carbonic anhydrase